MSIPQRSRRAETPSVGSPLGKFASPEIQEQLIEAARNGVHPVTAWRAAGLSYSTLQDYRACVTTGHWRNGAVCRPETLELYRSFLERWEQARAEHEQACLVSVTAAALSGQGKKPPDWKAAAWFLEHAESRNRYYRHIDTHSSYENVHASPEGQAASSLSDAELFDLAPDEFRALLPPSNSDSH